MTFNLHHLHHSLRARLTALLPSSCALCGLQAVSAVCPGCRDQFFAEAPPRCPRCATPTANGQICGACLHTPPAFDATIVASDYMAPVDQLVLSLKFGGKLALASLFADLLRDAVLAAGRSGATLPDVLAPVPLGRERLRERGFNQALEIARPLARAIGSHVQAELVCRERDTHAQAELAIVERQRNVRGAFIVLPDAARWVEGRHVGIVDDVITTGTTLQEIAVTLKRHGARRVTNLVFARTPPK